MSIFHLLFIFFLIISETSSGLILKSSSHLLTNKLSPTVRDRLSSSLLDKSFSSPVFLASSEENSLPYFPSESVYSSSSLLASKFPSFPSFNSSFNFPNTTSIFSFPSRGNSSFSLSSSSSSSSSSRPSIKNFFHLFSYSEKLLSNFTVILIKDPDLNRIVTKILSGSLWLYILLSFFGTIGIDTKPLISLISIIIFTLGLAGKDLLTNSLTGFFILFSKPFRRGDLISINGFKGKVLSIDIRYVRLIEMDTDEIEQEVNGESPSSPHIKTEKEKRHEKEILLPLSTVYNNPIIILKRSKRSKDYLHHFEKKND